MEYPICHLRCTIARHTITILSNSVQGYENSGDTIIADNVELSTIYFQLERHLRSAIPPSLNKEAPSSYLQIQIPSPTLHSSILPELHGLSPLWFQFPGTICLFYLKTSCHCLLHFPIIQLPFLQLLVFARFLRRSLVCLLMGSPSCRFPIHPRFPIV